MRLESPFIRLAVVHRRRRAQILMQGHVLLLLLGTTACAIRGEFPMSNPTTAQQVTCYTPYSRIMLGGVQYQIGLQCIHACQRHGFEYVGESFGAAGPYEGEPPTPDESARPY